MKKLALITAAAVAGIFVVTATPQANAAVNVPASDLARSFSASTSDLLVEVGDRRDWKRYKRWHKRHHRRHWRKRHRHRHHYYWGGYRHRHGCYFGPYGIYCSF